MERRTLAAWLVYNWETKARRWSDWNEGFDKLDLQPGDQLYFVDVELDPAMQFLGPIPHGQARITGITYKTPIHTQGATSWRTNLAGIVASLVAHAIPSDAYDEQNPLETRYIAPDLVAMNLKDTAITIHVKVQSPKKVVEARQAISDQLADLDDKTVLAMAALLKF